ncbi:MAG: haloacid dehalogenase [Verrucomicrobiales bacterium]|nr:haloacid dehalogenase [Verrucomicrobiales bacterium]|tara:strand:- start:41262 stop:42143 length:882 start_codon:yes stop_codon:yes gene_type:complete
MPDPAQALKDFVPAKSFFIGIDSDGCVFDSMEIKHKECFAPMFIKHFDLQAASKYAREIWEFVNLYSKTRGCNRFHAVTRALDLMNSHPEAKSRGINAPAFPALDDWMKRESKLGNATLYAEIESGNSALIPIREWSDAVNTQIEDIVRGIPPFPLVGECLVKMNEHADCMVISQTPSDALKREWADNKMTDQVRLIAGQEMGTKTEHLKFATGEKYEPSKVLMIGDAPGDHQAASANQALFFPINPGQEEGSWKRLHDEALVKFFDGSFAGDYQRNLLDEFDACLPEAPSWS